MGKGPLDVAQGAPWVNSLAGKRGKAISGPFSGAWRVFVWLVCSVHLSLVIPIIVPRALSPLIPLSIISWSVASFQNRAAYVAAIGQSCGVAMSRVHDPIVLERRVFRLTNAPCAGPRSSSSASVATMGRQGFPGGGCGESWIRRR